MPIDQFMLLVSIIFLAVVIAWIVMRTIYATKKTTPRSWLGCYSLVCGGTRYSFKRTSGMPRESRVITTEAPVTHLVLHGLEPGFLPLIWVNWSYPAADNTKHVAYWADATEEGVVLDFSELNAPGIGPSIPGACGILSLYVSMPGYGFAVEDITIRSPS